MDAEEAPKSLIPEKMKKFARAARTTDVTMSDILVFPEFKIVWIESPLKNINGKTMIAVIIESINKSAIGEILASTF